MSENAFFFLFAKVAKPRLTIFCFFFDRFATTTGDGGGGASAKRYVQQQAHVVA